MNKELIHKKIDTTIINMLNNINNIVKSASIKDNIIYEDSNCLEVLSSSESISNKLDDLLNIVSQCKEKSISQEDNLLFFVNKNRETINSQNKLIETKSNYLNELYNKSNTLVNDIKNSKYYRIAKAQENFIK